MSKKHMGCAIHDFLKKERGFEEAQITQSKRWSLGGSPRR
jgi:hypothetical protein